MTIQSLKKRESERKLEPTDDLALAGLEVLARKLVKQATSNNPSFVICEGEEQDDVILDLEVDGVRCLLLRAHPKTESSPVTLSPREQEIARMVAKGYPNKTIAAVLEISSWTVCTHLRHIFAKLSVGSRAAMVARLMEDGLNEGKFGPR
ncbi:MAG TPA: helix-turn-helix transcriptional regulator [Blastocatellia bacterium]|nr:helix-turn-helix transcriptional regulator [Blastocatellia bacterium]